jgi:hypothetical protein
MLTLNITVCAALGSTLNCPFEGHDGTHCLYHIADDEGQLEYHR